MKEDIQIGDKCLYTNPANTKHSQVRECISYEDLMKTPVNASYVTPAAAKTNHKKITAEEEIKHKEYIDYCKRQRCSMSFDYYLKNY